MFNRRYLCIAQVLHLLCDLGRIGGEEVWVVTKHHVLDEELTHRLKGDLLKVHLSTFYPQQSYVPMSTQTGCSGYCALSKRFSEYGIHWECVCVCLFVLLCCLSRGQGGGYRAARLCHIEELLFISGWRDQTLVLMTPNHQVEKIIQELLRDVVGGSVFTPRDDTSRKDKNEKKKKKKTIHRAE